MTGLQSELRNLLKMVLEMFLLQLLKGFLYILYLHLHQDGSISLYKPRIRKAVVDRQGMELWEQRASVRNKMADL
jgi:hypothetical protein